MCLSCFYITHHISSDSLAIVITPKANYMYQSVEVLLFYILQTGNLTWQTYRNFRTYYLTAQDCVTLI
jgi:hypothetical protein